MSFDGVFLHHILTEIKPKIEGRKIQKVLFLNDAEMVWSFSNKEQLLISAFGNQPHLRSTKETFLATSKKSPFQQSIKKYIESSILEKIEQLGNDRIIQCTLRYYDELGYISHYYLYLEFFGRNANLILTDEQSTIVDCLHKTSLMDEQNRRALVPKIPYELPPQDKINPFTADQPLETNQYSGVSLELFAEMRYRNRLDFIRELPTPTLIKDKKIAFHAFDLFHMPGERMYFDTLSQLLEEYYLLREESSAQSLEEKQLNAYLKREIQKSTIKLEKQKAERLEADKNLEYEQIGNLLSANLHKISKNQSRITVEDFYNNQTERVIELDSSKSASKNLEAMFQKYKKAKRALSYLSKQIEQTANDLIYYQTIEDQIQDLKPSDLREVLEELRLQKQKTPSRKKHKPNITTYMDTQGNSFFVGKNNIQNNYLTHEFAAKKDYFFHVKNIPGSHTILRGDSITEDTLNLAAMIAAHHSKAKHSSNVAVDYTLIRYVKKVPKTKGSFVTYTNHKTIYVTPDWDVLSKNTSLVAFNNH